MPAGNAISVPSVEVAVSPAKFIVLQPRTLFVTASTEGRNETFYLRASALRH